ncbi:MAG TPA: ArsA family ATPase [Pyrinomonadaceae bacterium]|nr:ArsA family ATPase [Pyrinomonadaceae bacterium]
MAVGRKKREGGRASSLPTAYCLLPTAFRLLIFGGKGGVGKTTAAASTALHLLDHAEGDEQILLFSTDPAHSLSDSLEVKIGDRLVEVARKRRARLVAYEMDASAAFEKFKTEHHATLAEIADRGTLLDESDINELLNLSLPGMDEVMALFELSELDRADAYARIVIDTAPSGHTSRLLELPELFSRMVTALDRMEDKHRYIVAQFARRTSARKDEVDLFLQDLTERINRVREMLYDRARTSFTLVTIPEAMSVEETRRYFALLQRENIPVTDLIINRIEQEHDDCPYCRARVKSQKPSLKQISKEFGALKLHQVPLQPAPIHGLKALRRFAKIVWEKTDDTETRRRGDAAKKEEVFINASPRLHVSASDAFTFAPRRIYIFGGKGGVGKTTAAASAALALAERDREARILVFSTDPAHSLSDSFGEPIGALKKSVAGLKNLDAMEIDPGARFEELKSRYRAWTDELFTSLSGGSRWEIQFDREAMRELVSLAPPGIDEIAALSAISDLIDESRYTTIVLDTAPTGHLLRFLELPEVALSWVRTFLRLLLKYQSVVRSGGVAEELIALSKSIKRVIALLTDEESCEFVGVTIPERMGLEETVRLVRSLERLKVPMHRLLINNVVPPTASDGCDFCRARQSSQESVIKDFRRRLGKVYSLFFAPEQPHEIRGVERLREHFNQWKALDEKR